MRKSARPLPRRTAKASTVRCWLFCGERDKRSQIHAAADLLVDHRISAVFHSSAPNCTKTASSRTGFALARVFFTGAAGSSLAFTSLGMVHSSFVWPDGAGRIISSIVQESAAAIKVISDKFQPLFCRAFPQIAHLSRP